MTLRDWNQITASLSPETPVIFYNAAENSLLPGRYCDGLSLQRSRMWIPRVGWVPCVTVSLGEEC